MTFCLPRRWDAGASLMSTPRPPLLYWSRFTFVRWRWWWWCAAIVYYTRQWVVLIVWPREVVEEGKVIQKGSSSSSSHYHKIVCISWPFLLQSLLPIMCALESCWSAYLYVVVVGDVFRKPIHHPSPQCTIICRRKTPIRKSRFLPAVIVSRICISSSPGVDGNYDEKLKVSELGNCNLSPEEEEEAT